MLSMPASDSIPSVLVLCPGRRDRLNLADERIMERFAVRLAGEPIAFGFDPAGFVEHIARFGSAVDGVMGSSDATGHLAAVLAERLGLPGPGRAAFMRCHDKLESRRIQAAAVPEATPAFAAVDLDGPDAPAPLPYPFFLKPVAAHLSQLAYRIDGPSDYAAALTEARATIDAVTAYDRALEGRTFRTLIAEELLDGVLVTFEGLMCGGRMTPVGVTDAVMHPNGISFLRFEYPSALPGDVQARMAEVAARLMPALGFDGSLFNIEFFVRPDGSVTIVEVNGRMASQFAPLVKAVHGVSTYELQLEIVERREARPAPRPQGHGGGELSRTDVRGRDRALRPRSHGRPRAVRPRPRRGARPPGPAPVRERRRRREPPARRDRAGRAGPRVGAAPLRRGARADAVRARRATGTGLGALAPCPPDRRAYACQPWPSKPTETTRPSSTTVGTMRVPSV